MKQKLLNLWRNHLRALVIIVLALLAVRSAVADWNDVPTGSMEPSILPGDRIFVNKLAYDLKLPFTDVRLARWGGPERGDIVVFFSPTDGTRLVKRIVGVPGDKISLDNDRLVVGGEVASYGKLESKLVEQIEAERRPAHMFFSEQLNGVSHPVMITPQIRAMRTTSTL